MKEWVKHLLVQPSSDHREGTSKRILLLGGLCAVIYIFLHIFKLIYSDYIGWNPTGAHVKSA